MNSFPQSFAFGGERRTADAITISAVLLVGGKSRRMRHDKATLGFRGKPLWQRQVETLRHLDVAKILVSGRADPSWRPGDIEFVRDDLPSRGPLSGLAATLSQTSTSHLLALAIDMPLMNETFLKSMFPKLDPGRGLIPKIGDRFEPLGAIYPREATVDFLTALEGNDLSLQRVAHGLVENQKLAVLNIAEIERALFRNLNEPADLLDRE